MRRIRFQSLHITHQTNKPVIIQVNNDYSSDVEVNGQAKGEAPQFQEGLFSMKPRPLIAFSLVTALASFMASAAGMIPKADELRHLLANATTDILDPKGAIQRPQVTLSPENGNATVILPSHQPA